MLAFVWAEDENHLIGKDGKVPWHLPNDLKFFKKVTSGHTIVMGRKTFEGMEKRLLPNRRTLLLTRDKAYDSHGAEIVSVDDVLQLALQQDIYIIGGSEVYRSFLPYVDTLYMTKIHATFDGDAYMPEFDLSAFQLVSAEQGQTDDNNIYRHTFYTYKRS